MARDIGITNASHTEGELSRKVSEQFSYSFILVVARGFESQVEQNI